MEASGYFIGGHYRAGNPQYSPEKQGKVGGGDHFVVEDLLDFSNEEEYESAGLVEGPFDRAAENLTVESCSNSFSGDLVCRSLAETNISDDICEPQYDELEELEWLSNFVEDSFSSKDIHKLHLVSGINPSSSSASDIQCNTAGDSPPLFPSANPLPGKARSKRSRASPSSWASRLLLLSPTRDSTFPSPESELLASPPTSSYKKISKAGKTKEPSMAVAVAAPDGRRCQHCATDKTPQWRTGPTGPKTLCNACGVRFKSGRLVPEYRPAASPTFVTSRHSNSHRKVLELRRQKEVVEHHQHQHHRRRRHHHHQELIHPGIVYDGVAGDEFLIHHRIGPDFSQLI